TRLGQWRIPGHPPRRTQTQLHRADHRLVDRPGQRGTLMFRNYSAFALSLLTLCTTTALAQHTPDLVTTYCPKCHNFEDWAGSLDLESLDFDHVASAPQDWDTVNRKLSAGMMPPVGE